MRQMDKRDYLYDIPMPKTKFLGKQVHLFLDSERMQAEFERVSKLQESKKFTPLVSDAEMSAKPLPLRNFPYLIYRIGICHHQKIEFRADG